MTTQPLVPNTILGNISLSDSSETDTAQPSTETIDTDTRGDDEPRDVIIVGSGPAGYTAAVYTARAGLKPLVFEGSMDAGGALMQTTEVENYPGFSEGIMGPDLMAQMRAQAVRFEAELVADDVTEVDLTGEIKKVIDTDGNTHHARAVILATGSAYRKLGLEDEVSAVEEATFLTRFANSVTLVHRRDKLRASQIMADRAEADPKITFAWNSEIVAMQGESKLESVTLRDTKTGEERQLEVSGVFEAIGHDPRSELLRGQVDLDDAGYVVCAEPSTRTNLPGVFACGDLVDSHYQQAITAAGSGCRAALDAERFLAELGR